MISSQIEGEEAASKAATVGKIYFNILRLECGEPKYPIVCLKTKSRDSSGENFDDENIGKNSLIFDCRECISIVAKAKTILQSNSIIVNSTGPPKSVRYNCEIVKTMKVYVVKEV